MNIWSTDTKFRRSRSPVHYKVTQTWFHVSDTLRLRRNNSEHNALLEEVAADDADAPDAAEKQADIIVREMEQHKRLMEDDPEAEELRRYMRLRCIQKL